MCCAGSVFVVHNRCDVICLGRKKNDGRSTNEAFHKLTGLTGRKLGWQGVDEEAPGEEERRDAGGKADAERSRSVS